MINFWSPERRTGLYFFLQFMAGGTANAFAGIWLAQQGLSEKQIGLVNSVPIAVLLLINIFVGRIADRASDWRQIIMGGAVVSGLSSLGLFWSQGFYQILIFWSFTTIAHAMIVPVADAAALYMLTQKGGSFGTMRSLATLGYLAGLLASGFLIGHFGAWLFLPLFVGLSLLRAAGSFQIPRFKSGLKTDLNHVHHFSHFLQPWLMLPLLGWSMVYATHLVLNGFQSLLWSQQGYSTVMISVLIGFGALSEAIAFYLFKHVHLKLDARWIILMSGVVSVFRWLAMAQEPAMIWLIPLQLLHGITFALGFLACVNYIGSNSNVKVAAEAQSFFLVLQQISGIIVISIFSWLASTTGSGAFYGSAAIALVGTVLIGATMQFSKSEAMPQV